MAVNVDNIKAQMRKGILEYCILSIISRGDSYASAIISELKAAEMIVVEGTLYPILTRQKTKVCSLTAGKSLLRALPASTTPSPTWAGSTSLHSTWHGRNSSRKSE